MFGCDGLALCGSSFRSPAGGTASARHSGESRNPVPCSSPFEGKASAQLRCTCNFPLLVQEKVTTAPQERREQRSWPRSGEGQDIRSQENTPKLIAPTLRA